jgi:hypothetical protein
VNTRNRKIQQYDSKTFELVKTFNGLMDVIRTMPVMSQNGVKHAALHNTVYHNYRWFFIDRIADDIKYKIPETVHINSSIPQYIAMLNKEKTHVVNVFASQKFAADAINTTRLQTVNDALKNKNLVRYKYYFEYFHECSEELRNEFLAREKLPDMILPKGTKISQMDIETRKTIKVHNSIADVLKLFCMSRASLKRACANDEAHKGFIWRYVDS